MSTKKANLILTTCSMAWGTSYISDSGTYIFQKVTER